MHQIIRDLLEISKKGRLLNSVSQLLGWDQETYMPPKAATIRGDQLALLAELSHQEKVSKRFERHLSQAIDLESGQILVEGLSRIEKAALREWRRDFLQAMALPKRFVAQMAKQTAETMPVWARARQENRFMDFAPYLQTTIELCQKKAEYLGYKAHPYDALLDDFEPYATCAFIEPLFQKVKHEVRGLLEKISNCPQVDDRFLHGSFSAEKQLKFGKTVLQTMGYDLEKGRLDLSTHPFSSSPHPYDSRITTRIHRTSLFGSLSAILHEAGHSLYEMGLPTQYYGSPICDTISLGIHESQSRLWETRIGQSHPFWHHFLPLLKTQFSSLKTVSLTQFYQAINRVEPSFIRVESDEVCYSLHVILRFELEKCLIAGEMQVKDIPEAWNQLMEEYLGIVPTKDQEGCLQDIHWSMGTFGYFPTYILGNLYAAHFFEAFEIAYPDWESRVARGDLLFLTEWLREKIHIHGRGYTARELLKKVCGTSQLSEAPYIRYLTNKYRTIYDF